MAVSWKTPKVGDVIILKDGYENRAPSGRCHYGLVLAVFKTAENPSTRYVMFAPGKTKRSDQVMRASDLVVTAQTFGNSNDTVFQLSTDTVRIETYPSECFVESHHKTSNSQPDQTSSTIGTLSPDLFRSKIEQVSKNAFQGDIVHNLCHFVLSEYSISIEAIRDTKNLSLRAKFLV